MLQHTSSIGNLEEKADISFHFHWAMVYSELGKPYHFPNPLSSFMKHEYKKPSVYRWNISREGHNTPEAYYIGEAQILCPNRLNNYIRPGPSQQTSIRIHSLLESYYKENYIVRIERLEFHEICLNDLTLRQADLSSRSVRCFLEEFFLTFYTAQGVKVLNK